MNLSPASALRLSALLLSTLSLSGCAAMFEDSGLGSSAAKMAPEEYSYNAKQYFHEGHWIQAKDQWQKQLEQQPGNWKARLGIAYCDVYLAINKRLRQRDVEGARKQLREAEAELRDLLGDAELTGSTTSTLNAKAEPWKAGLGLGMSILGQAEVDQIDRILMERRRDALPLDSKERAAIVRQIAKVQEQRQMHLSSSRAIFEQLAAMENASPEAIKQAGQANFALGNDQAAERYYLRYLDLAERTYVEREKQKEELPEIFVQRESTVEAQTMMAEKLRSNESKRFLVLTRLAMISFQNGRYEASLSYNRRAQKLRPGQLDLYVKMAQCQGELHRYAEAVENLDKYLRESARLGIRVNEDLARADKLKRQYERLLSSGAEK